MGVRAKTAKAKAKTAKARVRMEKARARRAKPRWYPRAKSRRSKILMMSEVLTIIQATWPLRSYGHLAAKSCRGHFVRPSSFAIFLILKYLYRLLGRLFVGP